MAQVDFSNAVLDVNDTYKPMTVRDFLGINWSGDLCSYAQYATNIITTGGSISVITNTPSKVSILFTGAFTASGTEFYIYYTNNYYLYWRVSNISFSNGDTYAFVIDIEVSGNT